MSEEVKRYGAKAHKEAHDDWFWNSGGLEYRPYLEIKLYLERQALADTKAQLEALEDALNIVKLFDPLHGGIGIHTDEEADAVEESKILVDRAIRNSRAREQR